MRHNLPGIISTICIVLALALFVPSRPFAASPDQNIQAGTAAYKSGDFLKAARFFQAAGEDLAKAKNPQAVLLLGNAAIAYIQGKDFQSAANLYERILAQKNLPKQQVPQYYANLVHCLGELKKPALQIDAIERQLKAIPKMTPTSLAETYARMGDAYREQEFYRPAAVAYDKALHILPQDARPEQRAKLLVAAGLCQRYIGDFANAEKNLVAARAVAEKIGQDLSIAEADSNLAGLRVDQGDYPAAIKLYQAAIDREKKASLRLNEGSDWNNMGVARRGTGNYEQAMKDINDAVTIAKEVNNELGEAIALQNRALGYRIMGQHKEARDDYAASEKLYNKIGEKQGKGTVLLGIGRMAELVDKNYALALQNYTEALHIFESLELPRWVATAQLYLGHLQKKVSSPGRTTRDLVFEDEPIMPELSASEAIVNAKKYYSQALEIGEMLGSKELIWEANQGLGFVDFKEGQLESALEHYKKAIDIVSSMYVSAENAQMLGEFMAGREDLYREAIEVCAALYDKTKDRNYLNLQNRYNETLKNEIFKASVALSNLKFENPAQQQLFEKFRKSGRELSKASSSIPSIPALPKDATPEQQKSHKQATEAVAQQKAAVKKLEGDYKKLLAEWKKKYPKDESMFSTIDSNIERMDTAAIQKELTPEQAMLQYISLPSSLLITVITNNSINNFRVEVSGKELKHLIYDKFVVGYIHDGFKRGNAYGGNNSKYLETAFDTLHKLYKYLIAPVASEIEGKKRLYIVCDGYLSQIPFTMLVSNNVKPGEKADFLVKKYEIANIRPSFMHVFSKQKAPGSIKRMLAVANPSNDNFPMKLLEGTIDEVSCANSNLDEGNPTNRDIALVPKVKRNKKIVDITDEVKNKFSTISDIAKQNPTETWLRNKLKNNSYEIIYFATHGQTQSDTYTKIASVKDDETRNLPGYLAITAMRDMNLSEPTPLNGFLYLSNESQDQVLGKDKKRTNQKIPRERDGLLTIGEIITLDKELENTRYVLLSACNAAVTLVPFAIGEDFKQSDYLDPELTSKALENMGLKPGVDQATFVESFMRHGVQNVYASYWQLDDEAGSAIMKNFWKHIKDQGDNPDLITALTEAQRDYISGVENGTVKRINAADVEDGMNAIHPYYWAPGAMFGK